jgi:hypothetical protein
MCLESCGERCLTLLAPHQARPQQVHQHLTKVMNPTKTRTFVKVQFCATKNNFILDTISPDYLNLFFGFKGRAHRNAINIGLINSVRYLVAEQKPQFYLRFLLSELAKFTNFTHKFAKCSSFETHLFG